MDNKKALGFLVKSGEKECIIEVIPKANKENIAARRGVLLKLKEG